MYLLELTEKELLVARDLMDRGILNFPVDLYPRSEIDRIKTTITSISDKMVASIEKQPIALISGKDFQLIKSDSVREYLRLKGDYRLSGKKVEESDFRHISLANALIMWFNRGNLLKRQVRFDDTDNSAEFEGVDE